MLSIQACPTTVVIYLASGFIRPSRERVVTPCEHLGHITKDTILAKRVDKSRPANHPKHIGKSGTVLKYNNRT
jgi:hypothetical protein